MAGIKQHMDVHDKILKCYANIVLMGHCHRRDTKIDIGRPNDFVVMFLCYSRDLVSAKGEFKIRWSHISHIYGTRMRCLTNKFFTYFPSLTKLRNHATIQAQRSYRQHV